jgi:hypothetical protein
VYFGVRGAKMPLFFEKNAEKSDFFGKTFGQLKKKQ